MHDIRKRARSNGIPTELTQYNLKPGLRKFGTRGEKAALKEMTQLHIMDRQAVVGAEDESDLLAALPQGETNGRHQGEGVHKRGASACIHPEGGCSITYCINGINVHYRDDHSKGGKESEVI